MCGCAWGGGKSRGRLGSRGKLPKFANFHPANPPNSARKAPLASGPRRKPELCVALEPEGPDAVWAISKVGGHQAGESAGAGKKGAAVSQGEADAWPGWPAGGRAGERSDSLAGGLAGGQAGAPPPPAEQLSNRKQVLRSPPPPAPHTRSSGVHGPAAPSSVLPGGLAYLHEAAYPGERESRSRVKPRAKRRSPRSLARTPPPPPRAGRAPCPPTPGRLGKTRTAAPPPHRTVPRQTAPARARSRLPARPPAATASDSGAVAVVATALPSRGWRPGCQAPTAARRALTHTHTAAGWPRLGIPGRTDPFPLFFSPPNFHVFITGLGHY